MKKLSSKWSDFLGIVLSPWFLFFTIATIVSLYFSAVYKTNVALSNLLSIFGSITGGLAGGIYQSEYSKTAGQEMLEKKGESAVRNLQAIRTQLKNLQTWVSKFERKMKGEAHRNLEEINRHLSIIELHIDSGYEDWIDVLPQLREDKKIREKHGDVLRKLVEELLEQQSQLAYEENMENKHHLEEKIQNLEKQITTLKNPWEKLFIESPVVDNSSLYDLELNNKIRAIRNTSSHQNRSRKHV